MSSLLPDLLVRRTTHFVLWRPGATDPPPRVSLGRFTPGNPPTLAEIGCYDLTPVPNLPDLWQRAAADCGLVDGEIYHYWFEVTDTRPGSPGAHVQRTDPTATMVDWRLLSPELPAPYTADDRWPAAVVLWRGGELVAADPDGAVPDWSSDPVIATLPENNRTVYYKLPTRWARRSVEGGLEVGVGTFRDVLALLDPAAEPPNFAAVPALAAGRAHLRDLGITTLELLPIADSWVTREWGYATSNYFAPDYDLGFPRGFSAPRPNTDLAELVTACHRLGIRFGYDAVMAFGQRDPYRETNFLDFHVQWGAGDPEQDARDPYGGDLFKYNYWTEGYDPIGGGAGRQVPARQLMKAHIARWIVEQRIDSIRIDSVNNVYNYDFVQEFTAYARALRRARWAAQPGQPGDGEARFLVVGEELSVPVDLVLDGRLDALWNERFKRGVRCAILGGTDPSVGSFEETVHRLVDCRRWGFSDGAQAINYVTSHDVEGFRNERLYDFLRNNGVVRAEERIKLAFACLLTAVGVPLILAGEEFADQHDLPVAHPWKQVDPVNFDRLADPWRQRVFTHVARLVRLRQEAPALSVNDTAFLHADFTAGRRVLAWCRGGPQHDPVVVVANFSDWGTTDPTDPAAEYIVPNWPAAPSGRCWREVTQDRAVPADWVGREPLYPWEAKVYTLAGE
jgi:glycosidase